MLVDLVFKCVRCVVSTKDNSCTLEVLKLNTVSDDCSYYSRRRLPNKSYIGFK